MLRDTLAELGFRAPDMVAGVSGGLVNAFVFQRTSPIAIVGSVVVGALTANYFAETAASYFGTKPGASAFIVGLGGMAICQSIIAAVSRWKFNPGGQNVPPP